MFKKLTFLTLLATPVIAATTPLTITLTELESGKALIWEEDYAQLTSWELSFTLNLEVESSGYIFQTRKQNNLNPYISLRLTDNAQLQIEYQEQTYKETVTLFTNSDKIKNGENSIILSFSRNDNSHSGSFFLSVNGNSATKTINKQEYIDAAILIKNTSATNYCYVPENFGYDLTKISLTKLDNLIIPEPATATLSFIGLLSLLSRRWRK